MPESLKSKFLMVLKFVWAILIIALLINYNPSVIGQSPTSAEYSQTQQDINASIAKIDEATAKLNTDLESTSNLKNTLIEQQKSVQADIDQTEAIIVESKLLINKIQLQIDQKQQEYDELVIQMKTILFDIEKDSRVPAILRFFSSENLVEALSRSYSYTLLQSKADQLRLRLDETKKELEEGKIKQETRKTQLEQTSFLLKSKRSGLDNLLNTYRNKESEYTALVQNLAEQRKTQEAQASVGEQAKNSPVSSSPKSTVSCWFEEPVPLDIDKDYLGKPTTGAISRIFDGCRHDAADIANSIGTELKAVADGVVYKKGYASGGYGNYVYIKHTLPSGQRVYALYGHMNAQSFLTAGDIVSKGSVVGYMGSTGYSTGPHVHFALFSESFELTGNEGCRNGGVTHSFCYDPTKYISLP